MQRLEQALIRFRKEMPHVKLELHLYTESRVSLFGDPSIASCVKVHKPIGTGLFEVLPGFDLSVILLSWHNKDFKTTKFFEYLPYKVPYLYVGPEGHVSESIEKEGLGYVLRKETDLADVFRKRESGQAPGGGGAIEQYSLAGVAKEVISCFA
jgi:hypothetical protein